MTQAIVKPFIIEVRHTSNSLQQIIVKYPDMVESMFEIKEVIRPNDLSLDSWINHQVDYIHLLVGPSRYGNRTPLKVVLMEEIQRSVIAINALFHQSFSTEN